MKKKKILIGIFISMAIVGLIYMIVVQIISRKNETLINEYIPEIEISDKELRKTLVTLYFVNAHEDLQKEERIVDSKELLRNPYVSLVGMLLEGPTNPELESVIPKGTKILDATLNKKCVTVNLSKEFIECKEMDMVLRGKMIDMIVNTLTELNEVQSVKFLIEGEEVSGFEEEALDLRHEFARAKM